MYADPSLAKEILVLFETPSGFAIFSLKYDLNQPDVMKVHLAAPLVMCLFAHRLICHRHC
jgi:hypothetical protein